MMAYWNFFPGRDGLGPHSGVGLRRRRRARAHDGVARRRARLRLLADVDAPGRASPTRVTRAAASSTARRTAPRCRRSTTSTRASRAIRATTRDARGPADAVPAAVHHRVPARRLPRRQRLLRRARGRARRARRARRRSASPSCCTQRAARARSSASRRPATSPSSRARLLRPRRRPTTRSPSLPREPAVFVDMAGNGAVRERGAPALRRRRQVQLHRRRDALGAARSRRRSCPGAPPTFFFAPTQMQKRTQDWGPDGFQQRYGAAWRHFLEFARRTSASCTAAARRRSSASTARRSKAARGPTKATSCHCGRSPAMRRPATRGIVLSIIVARLPA